MKGRRREQALAGLRAITAWGRATPRWLRDNAILIGVVCTMLVSLSQVLGIGPSEGPAGTMPLEAGEPELTAIGQARPADGRVWRGEVELPEEGGRVAIGLRVHNGGAGPVTNVALRMSVPDRFGLVPGSCRLSIDDAAQQECEGALDGEGTLVDELPAQSWLHVEVLGEVAPEVPGGRLPALVSVGSDQTEETSVEVEIAVAPTPVEAAVRALFRDAREVESLRAPEMAPRSERLLIERWSELAPRPGRELADLPDGPSLGLLRLYFGRRFAGQVVRLRARVLSPPWEFSAPRGAVEQWMEVGQPGGGARGWCFTVRPPGDLLRAGDRVAIKAVPIGWGGLVSARRLVPVTLLACPAVRLLGREGGDLLGAPTISSVGAGDMVNLPLGFAPDGSIASRTFVH